MVRLRPRDPPRGPVGHRCGRLGHQTARHRLRRDDRAPLRARGQQPRDHQDGRAREPAGLPSRPDHCDRGRRVDRSYPWRASSLPASRASRSRPWTTNGPPTWCSPPTSGPSFARTWGVAPERVHVVPFCHTLHGIRDQVPSGNGGYLLNGGDSLRKYCSRRRSTGSTSTSGSPRSGQPTDPRPRLRSGRAVPREFIHLLRSCTACVVPLQPAPCSAGQQTHVKATLARRAGGRDRGAARHRLHRGRRHRDRRPPAIAEQWWRCSSRATRSTTAAGEQRRARRCGRATRPSSTGALCCR